MRIYHYTTIETLALILHNKTIRFSRLDTVDDPDEYGFEKDAHNPAKYTYVSCWTTNNKESIPQWVMYGNQKRGVRISFDSNLFEMEEKGRHKYIIQYKEQENNDYFIMPIIDNSLVRNISYVENVKSYYDNIFANINGQTGINFNEVGCYKSKDWEFQQECRFVIYAFPKNIDGHMFSPSYIIKNNIYPKVRYIDLPIKESIINSIEIVLGPMSSTADRIIVESLCERYGINKAIVSKSVFI